MDFLQNMKHYKNIKYKVLRSLRQNPVSRVYGVSQNDIYDIPLRKKCELNVSTTYLTKYVVETYNIEPAFI